jgi:hypothetical protein
MRKSNEWANHLLSVDRDDAILLNMFDDENDFTRLLPSSMLFNVMKLKAGYSCEVFRHWVTTGEWAWSDKANREYVRPSLRLTP